MQKDNKLMLGYENFMDLVSSAFGTSHLALNITGGFIAAMTTFITSIFGMILGQYIIY